MINQSANAKTIVEILQEFRSELADFIYTRYQLLSEELREKTKVWKAAIPMLVTGMVFLLTAWLVFTAGLVSVIAKLLPASPWAYEFSFGIVAVVYGIFGAAMAISGKNALSKPGLKPEKTIRVLQQDKVWLETEKTRLSA
jgi:uncharacterized membrane protein YqjE